MRRKGLAMLKVLLSLAHSKTTDELQAFERGCGFDFEFNQATISKWLSIKEPLNMDDGFVAGGWLWQQCRVSQYDGKLFKPMQPATADYRFDNVTIHNRAEVFGGTRRVESYGDKTVIFHTSPQGIMRGTADAIRAGDIKHHVSVCGKMPGVIHTQSGRLQTALSFGAAGLNLRVLDYSLHKAENLTMPALVVLQLLGCDCPLEAHWLDEVVPHDLH